MRDPSHRAPTVAQSGESEAPLGALVPGCCAGALMQHSSTRNQMGNLPSMGLALHGHDKNDSTGVQKRTRRVSRQNGVGVLVLDSNGLGA